MASSLNLELEAEKFMFKLIQDSKEEPAKLATKIYVVLQHMQSSGKEHSMQYKVISRTMEIVINQNGLDIEALKSSRLPLTSGTQMGDSSTSQCAGSSSQMVGVAKDSKMDLAENEMSKIDPITSSRPPVGPNTAGFSFERSQVLRFSSNVPGNMVTESLLQHPTISSIGASAFGKVHGGMPVGPSSFPTGESGPSMLSPVGAQLSNNRGDEISTMLLSGKVMEHDGSSNTLPDSNTIVQELVPGWNKNTGNVGKLDEMTNYVQSLQGQVEVTKVMLLNLTTPLPPAEAPAFYDVNGSHDRQHGQEIIQLENKMPILGLL